MSNTNLNNVEMGEMYPNCLPADTPDNTTTLDTPDILDHNSTLYDDERYDSGGYTKDGYHSSNEDSSLIISEVAKPQPHQDVSSYSEVAEC